MLLDMPRDLVCYILEVYEHAEETGQWPVQAMDAVVTAVAKIEDAKSVTHYRPIHILSLCYRIYSTIRTRQALRFLAARAASKQGNASDLPKGCNVPTYRLSVLEIVIMVLGRYRVGWSW